MYDKHIIMKKSELKQLIKEEIIQQKLLEKKTKKASKINQNLSNLIEKMKKDFNIEDERF
jgi:ABC-type Zn2+ transport system substrate-binding protein/surface adhesin